MSKATRRAYDIILGAQQNKSITGFFPPLNDEELRLYNSVQEECTQYRARGIEPMFEIPVDALPDDDEDEKPAGESWHYKFMRTLTEKEFAIEIASVLDDLRDLRDEYIVADFAGVGLPVAFVQAAVKQGAGPNRNFLVEYGLEDDASKVQLFRLLPENCRCYLAQVKAIFHDVCVQGKEPTRWQWEDVSHILE